MRMEWLFLTLPTLLVMAFAEPQEPQQVAPAATVESTPAPPTESVVTSEWQQRAEYDINLAHTNIKGCNDRLSALEKRLDELQAKCKCAQETKAATPPANSTTATTPAPVRSAVAGAVQMVRKCANGQCSLVPVPVESTTTTTTVERQYSAPTRTYRVFRRW